MPDDHQIWSVEQLTRTWCTAGSKVMQGSAGVNQKSNVLKMHMVTKFSQRNPISDRNAFWDENSYMDYREVNQSSICFEMYMALKFNFEELLTRD